MRRKCRFVQKGLKMGKEEGTMWGVIDITEITLCEDERRLYK